MTEQMVPPKANRQMNGVTILNEVENKKGHTEITSNCNGRRDNNEHESNGHSSDHSGEFIGNKRLIT